MVEKGRNRCSLKVLARVCIEKQREFEKYGLLICIARRPMVSYDNHHATAKDLVRYSASHKQETRLRLLEIAADSIRQDGLQHVGVAGVMSKAGLTHRGFYGHFASREVLVVEAIGHMFLESESRFGRGTEGRSPSDGLQAFVRYYLSLEHLDGKAKGCPVAALLSDIPRGAAAVREAFSEGKDRLKDRLEKLFERMGGDDADPQANKLLAELVGSLMLARAEPNRKAAKSILISARSSIESRFNLGDANEYQ